jgi:hypothetical protein
MKPKELPMHDIPSELIYNRKWWWDPIDMEVFKNLGEVSQRQLVAISLEVQSQILKTQAAGLEKMAGALQSSK